MEQGNRLAVRYSFSNNTALNANATGNALSDTTISAVSNNGTERDRTNTVVGEFTSAVRANMLLEVRNSIARAAAARREYADAAHHRNGRQRRHRQLPRPEHPARLARAARYERHVGHREPLGEIRSRHNHVDASQLFGFDQFSTYQIFGTSQAMLEILSVGGPTANRFDAPRAVAQLRRQIGNLSTELATDEFALFAQDNGRLTPTFTFNYGSAGKWTNPTPQADNSAILSQRTA